MTSRACASWAGLRRLSLRIHCLAPFMSIRRRIVWTFAAVLGPLAALVLAMLALPHLVDTEAYKAALARAVKEATGRELVVDGPVRFQILPTPRVSASRVHFANAPGAHGAQMIDVRWVGATPSWTALLRGRIEVERLTLYQPVIMLETDERGVPNWQFKPGAGGVQPDGAPAEGFHLAIGRLRLVQGTVSYTNPRTGQTIKAEKVDATASVGALSGPLSIVGSATVNGVPLSIELALGGPRPDGHKVSVALRLSSGRLAFEGRLSTFSPEAEARGHLSISTGTLTDFVADVMQAGGQRRSAPAASVAGGFSLDADVEYTPTRIALQDFRLAIGSETATGSLALEHDGTAPSLQGHVALPKLDLEDWLAVLQAPDAFSLQGAAGNGDRRPVPAARTLSPFPAEATVSLALDIAELGYRKDTIRGLSVALEIKEGRIAVPRLDAVLPGDMRLHATAAANAEDLQGEGNLSLQGPRLRDTLAWLGIDVSGVPAKALQTLELTGKLAATADGARISDLVVVLDGRPATGNGTVTFGEPMVIAASLQADTVDLDPYLADELTGGTVAAATADQAPAAGSAARPAPVGKTSPVFDLSAKVGKLILRRHALGGVEADIRVQGNVLTLNALKVADVLGGRIGLQGTVTDFGRTPRFDVAFDVSLPDAAKAAAAFGLPKMTAGTGGISAKGAAAGTAAAMTLRDTSIGLAGATVHTGGTLSLAPAFRFDLSTFRLQAQEAGRLLAAATGDAQAAAMGPVSASGTFKGDTAKIAFTGTLTALGTQMKGSVGAAFGTRPDVTVNLRVPGTLDLDRLLGIAPASAGNASPPSPPRSVTEKSFDLSALRGFDATVTLETSAVAFGTLKILYADLQARLRNGILALSKLTGQFYGGAVDFAGTLDASRNALAVNLSGSLQGIYLGEMLRGTAGRNSFGNDHLTVAVDGKIDVLNISVRGSGRSPGEIRSSLTGRGQVGGYLYPAVIDGSLGFASFATGVASIFSTEMGFSSAVLSAFVNQQSTVRGDLVISDGMVALSNHMVQGQNAVALINSRNSLASATTDTTISLDTGQRGSVDYVVTLTGPVSSPTMTTRGGN